MKVGIMTHSVHENRTQRAPGGRQSVPLDCGLEMQRSERAENYATALHQWMARLDNERGAVFSSSYEYPGRYTRWDMALVNPPLCICACGRSVTIEALNARGNILLDAIARTIDGADFIAHSKNSPDCLYISIKPAADHFSEEERSRQNSVFSLMRAIVGAFGCADPNLGLYGAFGYDLVFQFEPVAQTLARPDTQRDLVLYLPDEILLVDHYSRRATVVSYEFSGAHGSTEGLARSGSNQPFCSAGKVESTCDHPPGEYAQLVKEALGWFDRGDLFEVVPGQLFSEPCLASPVEVMRCLMRKNPSPYGFLINLGGGEYLVGASPEMFVRVTGGRRVETCPISGTIRRGRNPLEDERQIRRLLNSAKDEAELTMCTDVDRNDKSRVCEPGSVRVIGRRQIELYSRLIHTVDHVEGWLRDGLDALDAFLSHSWAVTVTGAPKRRAIEFIESCERSPRAWYGGAVGIVLFNGDMNTGLTLRTIRIVGGRAEIRAGATLLADSVPEDEEAETRLKAAAMLDALRIAGAGGTAGSAVTAPPLPGKGLRLLFVDHEDSFVHMLAGYFRQTGADVTIWRAPLAPAHIDQVRPHLLVLSPGPGRPGDFQCRRTIEMAQARHIPLFGVCLGLQAIVEQAGGTLAVLDTPMHGKPSSLQLAPPSFLFEGVSEPVQIGRYHSLHAPRAEIPPEFRITATCDDDIVMAIEHRTLPVAAVQFHPESIMSIGTDNAGQIIITNALTRLTGMKTPGTP